MIRRHIHGGSQGAAFYSNSQWIVKTEGDSNWEFWQFPWYPNWNTVASCNSKLSVFNKTKKNLRCKWICKISNLRPGTALHSQGDLSFSKWSTILSLTQDLSLHTRTPTNNNNNNNKRSWRNTHSYSATRIDRGFKQEDWQLYGRGRTLTDKSRKEVGAREECPVSCYGQGPTPDRCWTTNFA